VQRSLLLFENSLKTEATREKYLYYLGRFKDFYKLKDYDSMLTIEQKQLQIMVEDYVIMTGQIWIFTVMVVIMINTVQF